MWRVGHIFNNPQPNIKVYIGQIPLLADIAYYVSQIQTDLHLLVVVLSTTGIVVFLLLLGEAIPHLRGDVRLEVDMENPYGVNVSCLCMHEFSNLEYYASCDSPGHIIEFGSERRTLCVGMLWNIIS